MIQITTTQGRSEFTCSCGTISGAAEFAIVLPRLRSRWPPVQESGSVVITRSAIIHSTFCT